MQGQSNETSDAVRKGWKVGLCSLAVVGIALGVLLADSLSCAPKAEHNGGIFTPVVLDGASLTAPLTSCATGGFCIQGSVTGVGPLEAKTLTLTLVNPNSFPIFVTSLSVTATDTTSCRGSVTAASTGFLAHDTSPIPTDSIPVAATTSSGPGQNTTNVTVTWTDSTTVNQTPCLGSNIPLKYGGHALWYGNCLKGTQNGSLTVTAPTVACVASTGRVTGGITVASGAGLVLDPGATVTGGVNAANKATEIMFCGASISGGVTVTKATGPVVIGNGSYCPGNTISGGLTVSNNRGGVKVVGNSVSGQTNVSNNSGPTPSP